MPISDTAAMIAGMDPVLVPGRFVFRLAEDTVVPFHALASFHEPEGLSLVVPVDEAHHNEPVMRLIRLNVLSDLQGVGLTAAVAGCLASHGIACNVIAAYHHDYLLVPEARAHEAVELLRELQRTTAAAQPLPPPG